MIVLKIFILLCIIALIAVGINAIEDCKKSKDKISFREAMDLAELPVVTFYQGAEKFNFLLDTGSNHSHISVEAAKRINGSFTAGDISVQGVGGATPVNELINTTLEYRDKSYGICLLVGEHLDEAFKTIKETTGVTVHGIIGNNFLSDNRYILDFDEYVAYSKI